METLAVDDEPREYCLVSPMGCPTPRERDLTRNALAMDFTLRRMRLLAEAAGIGGTVPATEILQTLTDPRRFPLPSDAAALDSYRRVYGHGNQAVRHLAGCGTCEPAGRNGPEFCEGFEAAARDDATQALRKPARGCPCLTRPALAGDHVIHLDVPIEAVPAVRLGDPQERSYEIVGIDAPQEFPAATIQLRTALRMSYAKGEIVQPVTDW
jgi:hypothetical protein